MASPEPTSTQPPPGATIVLIEDDQAIAELMAYVLEAHGLHVHLTESASRGLAVASSVHPDLIVTDLHMPGLNGIDVLLATRRERDLKGIPVMIITADQRQEVRQECLALGARTYLTKPFDGDELLSYVGRALHPGAA
jgi:DNA-binding response OmpR family regulator